MAATNISNFRTQVVDVTLSLDTNAYASGDVLADFQEFNVVGGTAANIHIRGTINDAIVIDKDDQGLEMDLIFSDKSNATAPVLGTENSAPSISDADAETIIGIIDGIDTWNDLGGNQIGKAASFTPIPFNVSNQNYLHIGAITRGAPTHTASGVVVRLYITVE